MFKFDFELLKSHFSPLIFLVLLTVILGLITYQCFQIQLNIGPVWDTYDLLADAALFAHQSIGYYDLVRPPVLPFITSLFFRVVGLSIWPIMLSDGLIFILGSVGLYFFLKLRFDNLTSFLGVLLFATFPIVLTFICSGLTDIPSVCISIWAFLFTVLAVKKDSKWFYLSFPLAMIAFLTRFTTALIIFPMLLYLFINLKTIEQKKNILIGILFSFIFLIPVFWLFYMNFGNPFYTFLNFFSSSSRSVSEVSTMVFFYKPDLLYFVKYMPSLIGPQAIGVVLVIFLGFLAYIFQNIRNKRNFMENKKESFKNLLKENKIRFLLLFVLIAIFVLTIQRVHYLLSEVIFLTFLYLLYTLLNKFNFKNLDMDFLCLSWFMVFFIFHSVYVIKDYRYFIYMAPPLIYFLMRGFKWTTSQLGIKIKNTNVTHYLFAGFLIFLLLFSTYNSLPGIVETNKDLKQLNEDSINISVWLADHDPNYKSKVIYSDIPPYSAWYLKMNVSKMPQFYDNQIIDTAGFIGYNLTAQDIVAYNNELDSNHVDYYISRRTDLNLINYVPAKHFGLLTLYQRQD